MLARLLVRFSFVRRLILLEQLKRDMHSQRELARLFMLTQGDACAKYRGRHNANADRFNEIRLPWMRHVEHI